MTLQENGTACSIIDFPEYAAAEKVASYVKEVATTAELKLPSLILDKNEYDYSYPVDKLRFANFRHFAYKTLDSNTRENSALYAIHRALSESFKYNDQVFTVFDNGEVTVTVKFNDNFRNAE